MSRSPDELPDTVEALEAKETARRLALGWLLLCYALLGWGAVYFWLYTPALGGGHRPAPTPRARRNTEASNPEARVERSRA